MINVTDIRLSNQFNAGDTRYLNGNLMEKITCEIDFDVLNIIQVGLTGDPNNIIFRPSGTYAFLNVMQIMDGSPLFADFFVGDTITVIGPILNAGTYTIINKFNNYTLEVAEALVYEEDEDAIIANTTVYKAFDFYFGLIENNEAINFNSKVDGNVQKFNISDASTVAVHNMIALGQKSWQIGSCEIENHDGISYTITHELYINPLWLPTWTESVYPSFFDNDKCLKYAFKIVSRPSQNDPNRSQSKQVVEVGNTGWINENVNTGITNYSISNIDYEDGTTALSSAGVILSDTTTTIVTFDIDNATDAPFTANSLFKVHFLCPPFDIAEYQNNGNTLDENFTFDSALQEIGDPAVDGEFARCITNVTGVLTSASKISISLEIELGSLDYARIFAYDTRKFIIAVTVADDTLNADETDSVTLLVDYDDFEIQLGTDNAVTASNWDLAEHPSHADGDTTDAVDYEFFSEDEVLSYCRIKIDATIALFAPSLRKIECGVRTYNTSTGDYTILDSISHICSGYIVVNGLEQVNFEVARGHKCLPTELFKKFKIERQNALDDTNEWYYDIWFPFLIGWEYWQLNTAIDPSFFNSSEPNDGFNDEWQNKDGGDWELQNYIDVTVRFGTADVTYRLTKIIEAFDYNQNSDWINEDIKAYDSNAVDIGDNIFGYDYTTIIAEMEYDGPDTLTVDDVEWCIRLEPRENGGRNVSTRFSSVIAMTTDTQWKSTDSNNKIIKSVIGSVFYAELKIDYNLLQQFPNFDITARIFETLSAPGDVCDVDGITMEDDSCWFDETLTDEFIREEA